LSVVVVVGGGGGGGLVVVVCIYYLIVFLAHKKATSNAGLFSFLPSSPSLFRSMTMTGSRQGLLSPTTPRKMKRRTLSGKTTIMVMMSVIGMIMTVTVMMIGIFYIIRRKITSFLIPNASYDKFYILLIFTTTDDGGHAETCLELKNL